MLSRRSPAVPVSTLLALAALVVVILALYQPAPASAQLVSANPPINRSIHVSGSSAIKVRPDQVMIYFGIESFADSPHDSRAANAALTSKVKALLLLRGVPIKDIATDYYSIRAEYKDTRTNGHRKITGYWTNNTVAVTLRDVDKVESVLVDALSINNVTVHNVSFSTSRLRELRDEARALAVQAAMEKAKAMAGVAGASLGPVQSINEHASRHNFYGYGWWGRYSGRSDTGMYQNVIQEWNDPNMGDLADLDDGNISLGQIVVQAQVNVTVDLVP